MGDSLVLINMYKYDNTEYLANRLNVKIKFAKRQNNEASFDPLPTPYCMISSQTYDA